MYCSRSLHYQFIFTQNYRHLSDRFPDNHWLKQDTSYPFIRGKEESWEQASRYWAAGPPTRSPDTDCPGRLSASGSKRPCFPPFPRQPEPPTCPGWGPLTVTQFLRSGSPCWPQRERTRPSPLPGRAALAQVGPECVRRLPPKPAVASPVYLTSQEGQVCSPGRESPPPSSVHLCWPDR